MIVKIEKSRAKGEVSAPPSKSEAHRLLICAALAGNGSTVKGVAYSEDIEATLGCISTMGIQFDQNGDEIVFIGKSDGCGSREFNCNESGSTLRFFIPLALTEEAPAQFFGTEKLMSRPLDVYEEIFKEQGIEYARKKTSLSVKGRLQGGEYTVRGDISSQFITGLLMALPLIGGGVVNVIPPVESRPYIEMTLDAMARFGIEVTRIHENGYKVKGKYQPRQVTVEGDHSNGAFLDAFGVIGGSVTVTGLSDKSLQGDRVYKEYFQKIKEGYCTLDISDTPDLGPVLMALGAIFDGVELTGTRRLKMKESDRGQVMKEVLSEFSVPVTVYDDRIAVCGKMLRAPTRPLDGYRDHRIVMSEALLMSVTGGEIRGAEAVKKSFPDFFEKISELGIRLETEEKNDT